LVSFNHCPDGFGAWRNTEQLGGLGRASERHAQPNQIADFGEREQDNE